MESNRISGSEGLPTSIRPNEFSQPAGSREFGAQPGGPAQATLRTHRKSSPLQPVLPNFVAGSDLQSDAIVVKTANSLEGLPPQLRDMFAQGPVKKEGALFKFEHNNFSGGSSGPLPPSEEAGSLEGQNPKEGRTTE